MNAEVDKQLILGGEVHGEGGEKTFYDLREEPRLDETIAERLQREYAAQSIQPDLGGDFHNELNLLDNDGTDALRNIRVIIPDEFKAWRPTVVLGGDEKKQTSATYDTEGEEAGEVAAVRTIPDEIQAELTNFGKIVPKTIDAIFREVTELPTDEKTLKFEDFFPRLPKEVRVLAHPLAALGIATMYGSKNTGKIVEMKRGTVYPYLEPKDNKELDAIRKDLGSLYDIDFVVSGGKEQTVSEADMTMLGNNFMRNTLATLLAMGGTVKSTEDLTENAFEADRPLTQQVDSSTVKDLKEKKEIDTFVVMSHPTDETKDILVNLSFERVEPESKNNHIKVASLIFSNYWDYLTNPDKNKAKLLSVDFGFYFDPKNNRRDSTYSSNIADIGLKVKHKNGLVTVDESDESIADKRDRLYGPISFPDTKDTAINLGLEVEQILRAIRNKVSYHTKEWDSWRSLEDIFDPEAIHKMRNLSNKSSKIQLSSKSKRNEDVKQKHPSNMDLYGVDEETERYILKELKVIAKRNPYDLLTIAEQTDLFQIFPYFRNKDQSYIRSLLTSEAFMYAPNNGSVPVYLRNQETVKRSKDLWRSDAFWEEQEKERYSGIMQIEDAINGYGRRESPDAKLPAKSLTFDDIFTFRKDSETSYKPEGIPEVVSKAYKKFEELYKELFIVSKDPNGDKKKDKLIKGISPDHHPINALLTYLSNFPGGSNFVTHSTLRAKIKAEAISVSESPQAHSAGLERTLLISPLLIPLDEDRSTYGFTPPEILSQLDTDTRHPSVIVGARKLYDQYLHDLGMNNIPGGNEVREEFWQEFNKHVNLKRWLYNHSDPYLAWGDGIKIWNEIRANHSIGPTQLPPALIIPH